MKFNLEKGTLSIKNTPFENGKIEFIFTQFRCCSNELQWIETKNNMFTASQYDCEFSISINDNSVSAGIKNRGSQPIFLHDVYIRFAPSEISDTLKSDEWMEFINSFNFGVSSGVKKVGLSNSHLPSNPDSSMVYILYNRVSKKAYMLSACLPFSGDYTSFKALHDSLHLEGDFGVEIKSTQERLLQPGNKVSTTAVQCMTENNPQELLQILGRQYHAKIERPLKEVKIGWNSWDYFAGAITSQNIYDNQRKAQESLPDSVRYFVIDEGYEPRWGVWEANWKFPEGLDNFCKKIKSAGGVPGIWTSPLLVNTYTDIYLNHPEWFAHDKSGNIATKAYSYGPMAFLDTTRKDVQDFIYNTFAALKQAGFKYFKVDFTQEILHAETFFDKTIPRGALIRIAFDTIRKAIGDDAYLLACGAPYQSVIGIADACRTTGDIHNFWGHVLQAATQISTKWWMNRNLWNNDPDFLIVRSSETSTVSQLNRKYKPKPFSINNYWLAGREMNLQEVKAYAMLVYLSAGDIMLSDDLNTLNETGLEIIRKILSKPLKNAAIPMDLFDYHDALPAVWFSKEEEFSLIALFNWHEDHRNIAIDLADYGIASQVDIIDFWEDTQIHADNGELTVQLPARSCKALIVKKK